MKVKQDARQECVKNVKKAYDELSATRDVVYCHDIVKRTNYPNYVVAVCLDTLGLKDKVAVRNRIKEPKGTDEVYNFIKSFSNEYHISPAFREISEGVGIPLTRIYSIIQYLAVSGRVTYFVNERKTIRVVDS